MPGGIVSGAATSDRVDLGAIAAADSMANMTALVWAFPTTLTSNRRLISKQTGAGASTGWSLQLNGTAGGLRVAWGRNAGATNLDYRTDNTPATANSWIGCAFSVATGTPTVLIYTFKNGVLTTQPCTTTAVNGSGTFDSDAALHVHLCNTAATQVFAFQGRIGPAAVFPAILSAAEITSWFMIPRKTVGANAAAMFARPAKDGADCFEYVTGNACTVTGATQGDGPPLVYPMSFDDDDSDQVLDLVRAA